MKTTWYARALFGASAAFFGVIALMWHDAQTWQAMSSLWSLPLGSGIGALLMIAQIAGGIGLMYPRTTRVASVVLCVVYTLFALAAIPGIVAAPKVFAEYDGFFEQFCLLCGAIAAYASTETNADKAKTFDRIALLGLGVCAISFGLTQALYLNQTAGFVPKWIPPNQMFWAVVTTIAFFAAAAGTLVNRRARLALRLMTLMVLLFGALVWIPLLVARPQAHFSWSEFALTLLIAGAAAVTSDRARAV